METIYVIGDRSIFDTEFYNYEQGQGDYYRARFDNQGAIVYSNDGTQVLLEEEERVFNPDHLALESTHVFNTVAELNAYRYAPERIDNWISDDII